MENKLARKNKRKLKWKLNKAKKLESVAKYKVGPKRKRPLLISFPRSGRNWLLYIINFLANRGEIPGQKKRFNVMRPAHVVKQAIGNSGNKIPKMIMALRNYKECIPRQFGQWKADLDGWITKDGDNPDFKNIKNFLENNTYSSSVVSVNDYIHNIKYYDQFNNPKLLIYYEDLIGEDINKIIQQIYDFMEFDDEERLNELLENLEYYREDSINHYGAGMKASVTKGKKAIHHSKNFTKDELILFDDHFYSMDNHIYNKYLNRYKEK